MSLAGSDGLGAESHRQAGQILEDKRIVFGLFVGFVYNK